MYRFRAIHWIVYWEWGRWRSFWSLLHRHDNIKHSFTNEYSFHLFFLNRLQWKVFFAIDSLLQLTKIKPDSWFENLQISVNYLNRYLNWRFYYFFIAFIFYGLFFISLKFIRYTSKAIMSFDEVDNNNKNEKTVDNILYVD